MTSATRTTKLQPWYQSRRQRMNPACLIGSARLDDLCATASAWRTRSDGWRTSGVASWRRPRLWIARPSCRQPTRRRWPDGCVVRELADGRTVAPQGAHHAGAIGDAPDPRSPTGNQALSSMSIMASASRLRNAMPKRDPLVHTTSASANTRPRSMLTTLPRFGGSTM